VEAEDETPVNHLTIRCHRIKFTAMRTSTC